MTLLETDVPAQDVPARELPDLAIEPSPTPPPGPVRHPHWRGLDGLRALAVITVVIFHFTPARLPGGFLGVDVFFVISGYLITRLLLREYLATGRIDAPAFYRRRARRLLPALGSVLVVVLAATAIWRDQLATVRGGVLATAGFVGNWWLALAHQPYFVATGRPSMLQHLWSLGVEEQFYLFWPLITAAALAAGTRAAARRGGTPGTVVRRLALIALAGAFASTALTWLLADLQQVPYGSDGSLLYYGTDTHCMGLLIGAALGAVASCRPALPGPLAGLPERLAAVPTVCYDVLGSGAVAGLLALMALTDSYWLPLYRGGLLLVAVLVAVIIAVATRSDSRVGAAFDAGPLRWIGLRSYSIYLWHWPVAVVTRPGLDNSLPTWLDQLLRIAVTLLLSELSYRFAERPVRRLGFRGALQALGDRLRPRIGGRPLAGDVVGVWAGSALCLVALVMLISGAGAPRPAAAVGLTAGGTHLSLDQPAVPAFPTLVGGRPLPHAQPAPAGQHGTRGRSGHPAGHRPPPGGTQLRHGLPRISGFGDSVMLGARSALADIFDGGSIDAIEGRQAAPILADVRSAAHAGTLAPLVVLHVGNNGVIEPSDLTRTLQLLSSRQLVIVFTDHLDGYDHPWETPNNALLDRVVPRFKNARLVRWNSIAGQHPGWLYSDDLHLRPAGATAYAQLIATTWRQAVGQATHR